ncbi:MAG: transporter substrate-binding domain-containing protein [Clostridia bacterium]|nr:transporter substrate-binding domain-containing protein [Clostridia bacterium]
MKKLIALSLALVMILALCPIVRAEEARTERIGVLSLLNQTEEELVGTIQATIMIADLVAAEGYSENLLPSIPNNPDNPVKFQPVYYDTLDAMVMALTAGDVEILNIFSTTAAYLCANNEELAQTTVFKPLDENASRIVKFGYKGLLSNDFAFMMLEGNEALRDEFNAAIAAVKEDGTLEKLVQEHIETAVSGEIVPVEMPVLEGAETVKVAITGSLPPMDYVAPDGTPAGFNTALLAEISRRVNKNIELVQVDSMGRAAALASGTVDAVFWTRTNSESNRVAMKSEEEREARGQQLLDQSTEEEREVLLQLKKLMNFADFGKQDMPEGTIITDAYYSDMLVPVALKTFVDFLAGMNAGN